MSIYIEYVITDNLIIDFLLMSLALRTARIKGRFLRLSLSAAVGTAAAVLLPLISLAPWLIILIKSACGAVITFIASEYQSVKSYFITYALFLFYTFLFGGVIIAAFYFIGIDYKTYFIRNGNGFAPLGACMLAVFLLTKLVNAALRFIFKEKDAFPFRRDCVIVSGNKRIKVKGFIDSGNGLYDRKSGLPIVIGSEKIISELIKSGMKYYCELEFGTVGGTGEMRVYKIDKLMIYNGELVNIFNNVLIGEGSSSFKGGNGCEVLLHPAMI